MKLEAMGDRVLVRRHEPKEKTEGGIYIPKTAQDQMIIGEILHVGPEVSAMTKGTVVVFSKYSGTEIRLEGETYLILKEEDILARIVK